MKRPSVSVIIPTYNGQKLLAKHLPAVAKVLQAHDEIVIVDDASSDETVPWLQTQIPQYEKQNIGLHIVVHAANKRFAAAVNSGVEAAQNPFVFLLNNDVSPLSADILETLLQWFKDENMFAVGCAEVHENSPHAQVFGRGTGGWQRGLLVHWYDSNQGSNVTLWTAGGSMLFDREKFLQIGGMDTLFYPAYEEDRDLSYRALKHGWKLAFEPRARVLHQHETTNASVFGKRKMQIDSWKNQYLLVWKKCDRSFLSLTASFLAALPRHSWWDTE